jgi:AcrR family transcriptional regulator
MSELQRSRVLGAALEEALTHGLDQTSASGIIARAGISRKTFYEIFQHRDDCFRTVFQRAVAQIVDVVGPLYVDSNGRWSERIRTALEGLLGMLEHDDDLGRFVLDYIVEGARVDPASRLWLFERLQRVIEDGHAEARVPLEAAPLASEVVVGGVVSVLHSRLQARSVELMALVNPLMWMIVLPYLGPKAAAKELSRMPPKAAVKRMKPSRGPLEGLGMRVTYRTARVLAAIAQAPGSSNAAIGLDVEVTDAGQISKLLHRLEGFGLIENFGAGHAHGAANAWRLTRTGSEVDATLRSEFAGGRPLQSAR